jgi:hypothetical protein
MFSNKKSSLSHALLGVAVRGQAAAFEKQI